MIQRLLAGDLLQSLAEVPAVCLLGPRQVGKTTLALEASRDLNAIYLDLESEEDRARLAEPELYLGQYLDRLVVLDEVHRVPGLFPVLRGLIDRGRRRGAFNGRYLLLGSASFELLRQSGESLAGRIRYLELTPFSVLEPTGVAFDELWVRGGFPDSLLAPDDGRSFRWRRDFIRTYLERDVPQFGPRVAAETLRRFWTMLAHRQGSGANAADIGRSLGVDAKTVARYLDLMVDLLLVRRLPPWHANVGKRLVKSPRVFLRDSGILHALLDIPDFNSLLAHPILGASWEGFVIENLLTVAPVSTIGHYYRTSGGNEIDLLLVLPDGTRWAIEVKRSVKPKPERGFYQACDDLNPARRILVYPGRESYPLAGGVEVLPLFDLARELGGRASLALSR